MHLMEKCLDTCAESRGAQLLGEGWPRGVSAGYVQLACSNPQLRMHVGNGNNGRARQNKLYYSTDLSLHISFPSGCVIWSGVKSHVVQHSL